ncbi:GLPGLI family protein [Bergeyella zoohelcum]|uniref:GLPGLI family protein n=1 Tax=Bergeyella zoohelcum TaxID=1015 RepID=UPI002A91B389|nr:GLPGLI family protein [Bergeyella zoohelcum]MDY6025545.1 GLPGLI family protein [Bergeyella zoohelcum]
MRILAILFILVGGVVYSQEKGLKVTYERNTRLPPAGNFDTHLYVVGGKSQYVYHQKEGKYTTKEDFILTLPYFEYINNYDFNTKKVEENRMMKEGGKLYAEWNNDIKWEITDEEKVINGYKVKKAITKSFEIEEGEDYYLGNAVAWFAPDIPYSTGPARYYGLPGLILELTYTKSRSGYKVKNIEEITSSDYQFIPLDKENKVDEKEDLIYFFHKNPKKVKQILKKKK